MTATKAESEVRPIALTDDEAVAVAIHAGRAWPTFLPTVDTGDEVDVLAAARRGVRSLIVRELLGDENDELAVGLTAVTEAVFEYGPVLAAYPVSAELDRFTQGWATVHYRGPGQQWTTDAVTTGGIHYLQEVSSASAIESTRSLIEGVYGGEPLDPTRGDGSGMWLCVSGGPGIEGQLAVKTDRLMRFRKTSEGELVTEELAMSDLDDELRRLAA